ncbi:MAG TPA: hypothetical protein VGR28_12340 [Candidatus Thermoplasmatota archaeon]|nr:hypothetical protein [Candidatus Thermoplasmatota archaeon]
MRCPMDGCELEFRCDACLHVHLVSSYNVRYVDVFGPHDEAWLDFCDDHAACTPSMLGL